MTGVDLRKVAPEDEGGAFVSVPVAGDEDLSAVVWVLGPKRRMPELDFARGPVLYTVIEGTLHIAQEGQTHRVDPCGALWVPRHAPHQPCNSGQRPVRVMLVRAPGPASVEEMGLGRVECPVCMAGFPVEKGDRPQDRFVCSDCGLRMTLEERDGVLTAAKFIPELIT